MSAGKNTARASSSWAAGRKARLWWGLALAMIVLFSLLVGLSLVNRVGRQSRTARDELAPLAGEVVRLKAADDTESLAALFDPAADPAWRDAFLRNPEAFVPPFAGPVDVRQVRSVEGTDIVQATVAGPVVFDGLTMTVYWPFYVRRVEGQWRLTFPSLAEHFGPRRTLVLDRAELTLYEKENRTVTPALSDLPRLIAGMETLAPGEQVPHVRVRVDVLGPAGGWSGKRTPNGVEVEVQSSSVAWWAVEPTVDLRARVGWALVQALAPGSPRREAAWQAAARFWAGQINQVHPLFDPPVLRVAGQLVQAGRWPTLEAVFVGSLEGYTEAEKQAVWYTAYLWWLAQGISPADLSALEGITDTAVFHHTVESWLNRPFEEVESRWQADVRVRYGE